MSNYTYEPAAADAVAPTAPASPSVFQKVTDTARVPASIAGAYHGYKRTGSAGWAIAYTVLGYMAPLIVGAVMVAQGFGKPKAK